MFGGILSHGWSRLAQSMCVYRWFGCMHGWRHIASWVAEARRFLKACSCLEVLEASMKAGLLSHGWPSLAGLSRHVLAPRCSRHAWLQPSFFQSMFVSRGARGMHACRHLVSQGVEPRRPLKPFKCLEVLEACIVGGILSHGWSKVAGLSSHVLVLRCSRHA